MEISLLSPEERFYITEGRQLSEHHHHHRSHRHSRDNDEPIDPAAELHEVLSKIIQKCSEDSVVSVKMLQTLNTLAGKISPHNTDSANRAVAMANFNSNAVNNNNNNNPPFNDKKMNHEPPPTTIDSSMTNRKNESQQQDQPDPDFIKMFVGQVPRSMDEADLTKMFSEYGRVHQINVLRDKVNGQSKGCCFVTFYTRKAALEAQNALHNIKTLPGMHHPIQMKPADSENRNERKLFVGMLSKKLVENDVRQMFEHFGPIEECTVLRDTAGQSKGCAFVTFTSKQNAISAIKSMHHSKTMEGCTLPLVVKFADTQKEKDQKRLQQMHASLWNLAGGATSISPQSYLTAVNTVNQQQPDPSSCLGQLQLLQHLQTSNVQPSLGTQLLLHNSGGLQNLAALNGSNPSLSEISAANLQSLAALQGLANISVANGNPMSVQNLMTLAAMTGAGAVSPNALSTLAGTSAAGAPTLNALSSLNGYSPSPLSLSDAYHPYSASNGIASKQIEGPEGANLFIYHLPQEFTDAELAQTFCPWGKVLSAKVFIDKETNLSKCFGFVSYDNPVSAQTAIQNMNGFQIGTKRLKVQVKRPKEASRPY